MHLNFKLSNVGVDVDVGASDGSASGNANASGITSATAITKQARMRLTMRSFA